MDPIDTKMIEVTAPRDLRRAAAGVTVHNAVLASCDVGTLHGLRVTSPARTIVDLAAVVSEEELEITLDCVLAKRMTTVDRIQQALHRLGSRDGRGRDT